MNNYDGKIVIKTTLDNSDFDKEIADLTKKYNNIQKKIEDVWAKKKTTEHKKSGQRTTEALTPEELDYIDKLQEQQSKIVERKRELLSLDEEIVQKEREITQTNTETAKSSEEVTEQSRTQTAQISTMSSKLEQMVDKYNKMQKEDILSEDDIRDAEVLKADILELVKKIEELSGQKLSIKGITEVNEDIVETKNHLNGIGSSLENVIKKVAKWGLAIFGVRSAYMFIRQAMATLSQYDDKLSADIQYIRYVLASTLKPIIEKIINLVYKLLAYIGYIAKAWFGVNIFANASAKAFQKVNKGVKDTSKSAQKLQKTLAGFDEMNILQENGSVGTGGGGGGIATPSMDLANLDDIEIPEWVKWIAENKETILNSLKDIGIMIGITFGVTKLLEFIGVISKISGALDGLSSLQIFGIIAGLSGTIWGIVEVVEALTEDNFHLEDALKGVSDMIIGIGLITASFTPWGWVTVGIGLLGELISSIIDTRTDTEKLEEANRNLEEAQRAVNDAQQEYINASKTHLNAYKNYEKAQTDLKNVSKKLGITTEELTKRGEELYSEIKQHPEKISELSDEDKTLYEAYLNVLDAEAKLKTSVDKLKTSEENLANAQQEEIKKQLDLQKVTSDTTGNYEEYRDAVIDAYEKGAISGEEATGRIADALAKTDKESKQIFVDGIPGYIQDMMNTWEKSMGGLGTEWRTATDDMKIYTDSLAGKFNSKFGTDIPKSVQKSVDKIKTLTNLLNKLPFGKSFAIKITSALGGNFNAKGAIYYPPKLAVGGIINQPGRGVPLAMGGERGAEGVIPLTDSQAMSTLGQIIAKNISVNLNNTIEMNGRVISRELKQIQNEEDFAFNGG